MHRWAYLSREVLSGLLPQSKRNLRELVVVFLLLLILRAPLKTQISQLWSLLQISSSIFLDAARCAVVRFPRTLKKLPQIWKKQFLEVPLNILLRTTYIFEILAQTVAAGGARGPLPSGYSPVALFFEFTKYAASLLFIVFCVYLIFYFKNFIAREMQLHKKEIGARFYQIFDRTYVLAHFFAVRFVPLVFVFFLAYVAAFFAFEQMLGSLENRFAGLQTVSDNFHLLYLLWELLLFVLIICLLFAKERKNKRIFF